MPNLLLRLTLSRLNWLIMSAIKRYHNTMPLPFSRALEAGGFLFLSGQLPLDKKGQIVTGDIVRQTHAVFDRIEENLAAHQLTLNDVVKATVWLADLKDYPAFNAAYAERFQNILPTRSLVEAKMVFNAAVEIEIQAWLGATSST